MKKAVAIIVALILVLSSTSIAFAEVDYSTMSNEELYSILNAVREELFERELTLSPDEVLIENDVVKMYIDKSKDIEFTSRNYLVIPVVLVNKTEDEISFQSDSAMVNGWECYASIGNISAAGQKRSTLEINCEGAEITSIDEIEDIRLVLLAFNMNTFKREITTDPITIIVEDGKIVKQ